MTATSASAPAVPATQASVGAEALRHAITQAVAHAAVREMAQGLALAIRFVHPAGVWDLRAGTQGGFAVEPATPAALPPQITIAASADAWAEALLPLPAPTYQSFAAWQLRNPAFAVTGDALAIAQARAFLECLIERWHPGRAVAESALPDLCGIRGRYHRVRHPEGMVAEVFVESAGEGPPLLCLHTAGADARQYHGLMAQKELVRHWRAIAFDMPSHGRSMPADTWDGAVTELRQREYLGWCVAVLEQVIGEPVTVLGCSMGAAMALVLAAERPDLVNAVMALEAPVRPRGRRNAFLAHAQVSAGWHNAAYVRGLMSPHSPLAARRRAAWIYSQGAPGVYDSDLAFYSDEFDGEEVARRIDGTRTPVVLLTGSYDFSATVADAQALAGWIAQSRFVEMPDLGHFPMSEDAAALMRYLLPELDYLRARAANPHPPLNEVRHA